MVQVVFGRRVLRLAVTAAAVALCGTILAACGPPPGTFVVDSTADDPDQTLNGQCRTSAGKCTLRAAIQEANNVQGVNQIWFSIPGGGTQRISPSTQLPTLTDQAGVTIDGYKQPGAAVNTHATASNAVIRIEIRGTGPSGIDGLLVQSPNNVIRGLAMWEFRQSIRLIGVNAHDNQVLGNFLGTNAAATARADRFVGGSMGVNVQVGATNNRIGKPGNEHRNVLSGNYQHGVGMYNCDTEGNLVQNNLVGLRPAGTASLPNRSHGIDLNTCASHNLIGGTASGERNVVSGNLQAGVEISHDPDTLSNRVIGNLIGTSTNGASAPSFAANGQYGVNLEGIATCADPCPPDSGSSTVTDNIIVNSLGGVFIHKGDHDNLVSRNRIGVLANGTPAPNRLFGVRIEKGSFGNQIGPDNEIAHNPNGVQVVADGTVPPSPQQVRTYSNTITRNRIYGTTPGLGIDLAPLGSVTLNPSALVNDSIDIPTLAPAFTSSAVVIATTCPGCTVELFLADAGAGANGEGREYLGSDVADDGTAQIPVGSNAHGRVVTATATDPSGNTSEFARNITVPRPQAGNAPPTASFTVSCSQLTCDMDAGDSSDPDGAVQVWSWSFGDGATGSGETVSHRYSGNGPFTVTLTVTDDDSGTNSTTRVADPANADPEASFTATCNYQACTFDGSGSTDTDGSVASYAWDFGDGDPATGNPAQFHFAAGGTFPVTLTVTDNDGAEGSITEDVTVDDEPEGTFALDDFSRQVDSGWGSAQVGGAYNHPYGSSNLSVTDGTGVMSLPSAGGIREVVLPGAQETDVDLTATFEVDKAPVGNGIVPFLATRHVSTNNEYRAQVRLNSTGSVLISLTKLTGTSTPQIVAPEVVTGLTALANQPYAIRMQATGSSPTSLRAKVWLAGTAEPTTWQIEATDGEAALQTAGASGLGSSLAQSHTGTGALPVRFEIDDVLFRRM